MNFESASIITLFIEGLVSFFSPCVLPLIPLYIAYLTSNASSKDENGDISYKRGKVMMTTTFFVLGICSVFFIMGLSANFLAGFFEKYQLVISLLAGVILIIFGLMYLDIIKINILSKSYKLEPKIKKMNFLNAYVLGFSFSFAWTPCVGPMLASAIVMAASAESALIGNLYILAYAIGFVIPFLALGLFTKTGLNLIRKHQNIIKWTIRIGGILIICVGLWMVQSTSSKIVNLQESSVTTNQQEEKQTVKAYEFELYDQFGNLHKMSDYDGEVVMVQFFATWCTYCKNELPNLNKWAKETGNNVLLVANPNIGYEKDSEAIIKYLNDNDIEIPCLIDENAEMLKFYGVASYPTTFMIDKNMNLFGYLEGALNEEMMNNLVKMTEESTMGE